MTQRRPIIYKHLFQIVVLNDQPNYSQEDLRGIGEDIDSGDSIGQWERVSTTPIPARRVRAELGKIGNDGTFFDAGI